MRAVCARWVPRNLTEEQMQRRVQVCTNTVKMSETIPNFLTSIVTCDESWIHHYDPSSKQVKCVKRSNSPTSKKNSFCLSRRVKSCFCCSLMWTGWSYSTGFPVGTLWTATIMQTSWKPICVEPWGRKDRRALCHPNLYLHCGTISLLEIKKSFAIIIHERYGNHLCGITGVCDRLHWYTAKN